MDVSSQSTQMHQRQVARGRWHLTGRLADRSGVRPTIDRREGSTIKGMMDLAMVVEGAMWAMGLDQVEDMGVMIRIRCEEDLRRSAI